METFSSTWWTCIVLVVLVIALLISLPKYFTWARSNNYPKIIAAVLLSNLIVENAYAYYIGVWNIKDNLPLHICGLSGIMSIIVLYRFNTLLAHVVYYWGLTGGIHSLLTPEFDQGTQGLFFYSYFIGHGGLILTCIYLIVHCKFKPENNSWSNIFLLTQIAALSVGFFNWLSGSNYMYLTSPPIVDNPLIIGDWPWYILIFELLAFIHFFFFYKLSKVWK
jgi:hypothetical integral membrane protein (TIGR02206 family)